jgi:hypothetical protein
MIFEIVVGVVLGAILVLFARLQSPRRERLVLAAGLFITALLYVGFALAGRASAGWVALEALGLLPFTLFAWLGLRGSPAWLALGWATHVGWDVGLHLGARAPEFVPGFFPVFCIGFDLLVAGYIAAHAGLKPSSEEPTS